MNAKKNFSGLTKATAFIEKLPRSLIELLGNPTISIKSDYVDVRFTIDKVIRDFIPLHFPGIEYRMFSEMDSIILIYTFPDDEN